MGITSVRTQADLSERLEATAARLRRSKSPIINQAVEAFLEQEQQEQLRWQETLMMGRPVAAAPDPDIVRDMVFGNHTVRCAIHGQMLTILRIWHHL
ncbi:MAG: ribbon-helix-helix domain-containing protein [Mariprofundaceae bacterium]|nr:ribbon-helix-helix domain-containing protein [Mariprofundaceae bacterium]